MRRLSTRLLAGMLGIALLTATVVSLLDDRALRRGARDLLERELRAHAELLAALVPDGIEREHAGFLQERLVALGAANGTRYTVIDAAGNVLADSEGSPAAMDNHLDRPEVAAAAERDHGIARRRSASVGDEWIYLARPVRAPDGRITGFVRAARNGTEWERAVAASRWQLFGAAVLAVGAAGLLAWVLARGVVRPVAHLQRVAQAMAQGEDRVRAAVWTADEFAELGTALNTMADRLQERVEEMRRERAKLSAIIGSMVEGVVGVDAGEHVLHLNAAAAEMLGVDDGAIVGRPLLEVTRIPEVAQAVAAVLASGEKASREVAIHEPGSARVLELEAAPLRDQGGAVHGAVVVLHDVTELRRLEAMRRDFVANVSHELKTPLTAIQGMVDTMVDDPAMPDDVRTRFLQKVQRQAHRLGSLVSDLLVLARIEAAQPAVERHALDLREPVRESCQQLAAAAGRKRLRLHVELPDAPVTVDGEPEALRQAVDNLLSNAIRYTPEGGQVTVGVHARDGDAEVVVRDTGIGIAAEHLDRIFERFYRVDKARSRELGGTGLGLSIVKHVALAHGGTVSVESRPGHGSAFRVRIPLASPVGEERKVS
ncbi:MAG TPA: ATP-binding protein [Planctomycetota bacterium]|nr:ATP-binding protein [Planctomycetota bacterium]